MSRLLVLTALLAFAAPAAAQQWGTIKGRIVWGANGMPEVKAEIVTKDQKHCLEKGPVLSDEWVVDPKSKGVRYVYVWLVDEKGKNLPIHPNLKKVPAEAVEVDQPCCKFDPHAVALRQGQKLLVKNSSPVAHNVDWKGIIPTQGNNTLVGAGQKVEIEPKASRYPISVSCGIHPWMKGYVRVFDHPYFAVTKADGTFEIKNVPAGKCRIVIWHETGWRNQETKKDGDPIEVKAGGVTDLGKLDIKPPAK